MSSNTVRKILDHAGADDWYDAWGTALNLAFDICEVLNATGEDIPSDWEYRRRRSSQQKPSKRSAAWLAAALRDGDITVTELIHTGHVVTRYGRLLALAGRDY